MYIFLVSFSYGVCRLRACVQLKTLSSLLKQKPRIEGTKVGAREINITQYADDTTVFLKKNNPESKSLNLNDL